MDKKIAFLGGGAMASALIRRLLHAGLVSVDSVIATDISESQRQKLSREIGIKTGESNTEAVQFADIVVLAVKPAVVPTVLNEIGSQIDSNKLVISIAAGIPTSRIEAEFASAVPVIRVMPNTPAQVGEGASALCCGSHANAGHMEIAKQIFATVGLTVEVPESQMDAVTGLSGSGPGYVFVVLEALADGGVRAGLPRATALHLAAQTLLGAAKMMLETGKHPGELKDMVTSPGGTTIHGIAELERAGVRSAFIEAVTAATLRSKELGKG